MGRLSNGICLHGLIQIFVFPGILKLNYAECSGTKSLMYITIFASMMSKIHMCYFCMYLKCITCHLNSVFVFTSDGWKFEINRFYHLYSHNSGSSCRSNFYLRATLWTNTYGCVHWNMFSHGLFNGQFLPLMFLSIPPQSSIWKLFPFS